jgi:hypothetical protein
MPSLPDIVERMPPPARMAVTVAPPMAAFAASLTSPTIVPKDTAAAAGAGSSAWTTEPANAIDATAMAKPGRHFTIFGQLRSLTDLSSLAVPVERNTPAQDRLSGKLERVQKV